MRFKGTLVLFLVFAVLGGYVYFTEIRGRDERARQELEARRLFGGEAADIAEMTLQYEDRTFTAVRKGEDNWEFTEPAGYEADSEAWTQLASNFVQIEKDEVISSEKTELAPYGLEEPAVAVSVKRQDGSTAGVLFGAENPRKTFNYAKETDSDEVFLTATSWSGLFRKNLTDLRNKQVLDFESADIDSIRIAAAGNSELELRKSGEDWLISRPRETRADNSEVSSFLSSIQFSRASAFAEETVDAGAAGIDSPAVRITLHDQMAGTDKVLLFGKSSEEDKYYAKDQSRSPIFILGTEIIDKARQPLFDWRDKSLGRFDRDAVDEITITRGDDGLTLKKSGTQWQLPDGRNAQQGKISDMLFALESERVLQIVDSPRALSVYGLAQPRLRVILRQAGKDVLALELGAESADPAGVYARVEGNPAVLTAGSTLYDTFNVMASDLAEPPADPEPPSN